MRVYDSTFAAAIVFMCLALPGCGSYSWSPKETSSQRGLNVPAQLRGTSMPCGLNLSSCTFDLNYFYGTDWVEWSDAKSNNLPGAKEAVGSAQERPKYILFIPGGPGDIVDRYSPPPLGGWKVNRVYFDVRGTGLSMIPDSNAYDKFLRAEYVADDIETLRQQIFRNSENECMDGEFPLENECRLGRTPWDAVYAHSWGTIVAQIYAWKYPKSVDKLILSSPVSRAVADTTAARRAMIVDNLMKIYEAYTTVDCSWPSDEDIIKQMGGSPRGNARLRLTDNFCFLGKDQKDFIKKRLRWLLYQIEREYGSTTFVSRAYGEILKSQEGKFRRQYRYPLEFFRALRQLEWFGSGEDKEFRFDPFVKQQQIDAAFFVGYYLLLRNKPILPASASEPPPRCARDAPFLETIPIRNDDDLLRRVFCHRIDAAREDLTYNVKDSSFRAWTVFGIYDGLVRWISELLEREGRTDNDGCFKDSDLRQVANGTLFPDRPFFQTILRKLGPSSEDKICPWNPARYLHKKETLILTGGADPVTAGKQAMDFYENGLTPGKRAIIIFPRAGHEMQPQMRFESEDGDNKGPSDDTISSEISSKLLNLVDAFVELTVGQFVEDEGVKDDVDRLGAKMLPCKAELPQKKDPC